MYIYTRHETDSKDVLVRGTQAELGTAAKQERPHVHAGAGGVRGDELGVPGDGHVDGAQEEVVGRGGHGDEGGAVLHAAGVQHGAEHADVAVVGGAEGLEALVALLAVVEPGREAVHREEGRDDEGGRRPGAGAGGVAALDVAVDLADTEADVGPVWGERVSEETIQTDRQIQIQIIQREIRTDRVCRRREAHGGGGRRVVEKERGGCGECGGCGAVQCGAVRCGKFQRAVKDICLSAVYIIIYISVSLCRIYNNICLSLPYIYNNISLSLLAGEPRLILARPANRP